MDALKRELRLIWITGGFVFLVIYSGLGLAWDWILASQWLIQSALLGSLVCYMTFTRLELNRIRPDATLYTDLGWANRLTLIRGGMIAMTGGFIFLPLPPALLAWAPGLIYTGAAVIDRLDGFVARKNGRQSLLGTELDTLFDALGLAVAPLLAVTYGQIHWSYLMVSIAYYLFHWGIYYRKLHGLPVYSLRPNPARRAIAGYQMGFIAVALWPLFQPPATVVAGFAFMLPLLLGFCIDWLITSGGIDPDNDKIVQLFNRIENFKKVIFQPLLRVLVILLLLISISRSNHMFILSEQGQWATNIFLYGTCLSAGLLLLGVAGRIFALVLVGFLGWRYLSYPMDMTDVIILVSLIWIMTLGTGAYSFWQGDEDWVNRYDGA